MLNTLQEKTKPLISKLQPNAERVYVQIMIDVIARGLVSASHNDPEVKKEIAGFKVGQTLQMIVLPNVAQFTLQVTEEHTFKILPQKSSSRANSATEKADLIVKFKHVSLAFLVFSFQESTAKAFARDRLVADGDVSDAIRFVRCLNRLEVIILPKIMAKLAVKNYPHDISLTEKISTAAKVYAGVAKTFYQ